MTRRRRRRIIHFGFLDNESEVDYGNWVMLLIYARTIDREKFIVLDSYNECSSIQSYEVKFDKEKLEICIEFITQLIECLRTEEELGEVYSEEQLIEITDSEKDFAWMVLFPENNFFCSNGYNIDFLGFLRDKVLKPSLLSGAPHWVYVY